VQRTLTSEQKAQAAQAFDAEGEFLSAGKKLLDTRHAAFRAVTAIRTKVTGKHSRLVHETLKSLRQLRLVEAAE
jgi:hypothetical protein